MISQIWYEGVDLVALIVGITSFIGAITTLMVSVHKIRKDNQMAVELFDKHINNSDISMRGELNEKLDRICMKQEELTDDVKEVKQDIGSVDRRIGHLDDRIISLDKRVQRVEEK
jgi:archaellum component FlaC